MKQLLICLCLLIFSGLYSCNKALVVKRSYTCQYMLRHPLKDTIGSIRNSYKVFYKGALRQDEIDKCLNKNK